MWRRANVWHDSFKCVTWLIQICGMTHSNVWHDSFKCAYVAASPWPHSFFVLNLLCGSLSRSFSTTGARTLMREHGLRIWKRASPWRHFTLIMAWPTTTMGDVTKRRVFFTQLTLSTAQVTWRVTWLIPVCNATRSNVWRDWLQRVTWRIQMATWRIQMWWHDPFKHRLWIMSSADADEHVH